MHYKFCPECGAKLVDRQAGDDGQVPYCTACGQYPAYTLQKIH